MTEFQLQPLFQISGISSASGLVYKNNSLFIISDNSSFLYKYTINESKLEKIKLFRDSQENIDKAEKSDFESITLKGNTFYIFGSGSTPKRNLRISYNLESKIIKVKNDAALYEQMKLKGSLTDSDLNIEGVFFDDKKKYFFQRGNGAHSKNGIFISDKEKNEINFHPILLPKIQQVEATFTDAILFENHIYFLAAAEDTMSTYDDGEIRGCFMGCLSLNTLEIVFIQQISEKHKFEGLSFYNKIGNKIEFLLCEDNDTTVLETIIYKLTLSL